MEYALDTYIIRGSEEPSKRDVRAMKEWIKTGDVSDSYLRSVLGDQSIAVCVLSK